MLAVKQFYGILPEDCPEQRAGAARKSVYLFFQMAKISATDKPSSAGITPGA